jgi:hypothetical protein
MTLIYDYAYADAKRCFDAYAMIRDATMMMMSDDAF